MPLLRHFFADEIKSEPITPQGNINYLQMAYIENIQNRFNFLSHYLCDIEMLELQTGNSRCMDNGSVIDLTVFKKLKMCIYSIGIDYDEYDDDDYEDFILIEYTNGDEECYDLEEDGYFEPDEDDTDPRLTIRCDRSVELDFRRN